MQQSHTGVKVFKLDAPEIISKFQEGGLIDPEFRIRQEGDYVIIPIRDRDDPLINNLEVIETWFDQLSTKPNSLKEALKEQLPSLPDDIIPTSFDQIGDIAIIDLKQEMLSFRYEVGKALLEVHPSIATVFRKSGKVSGQHRLRELEHIGGEFKTETIHKEHGLHFQIDVEKVYFSPRLATEHARIAQRVNAGDRVLDLFGGVAPFGLHIAQSVNADVISVDINPEVVPLIRNSLQMNRDLKGEIRVIEGEARKTGEKLLMERHQFDIIIMNHPSNSLPYLELAEALLDKHGMIFLYIFAPMEGLKEFCEEAITQNSRSLSITAIQQVRQSSPSEYHVCIELSK